MTSGWELLVETFREEATELLNELAQLLEAGRASGLDPEALVAARRVAHNLKGAALSVGAGRVVEPCHALEDEFELLASSSEPVAAERLDDWLRVVTQLHRAVEDPRLVNAGSDAPASQAQSPVVRETTIRVQTRRLDDVMSHAREVKLIQTRFGRGNREALAVLEGLQRASPAGTTSSELVDRLGELLRQNQQDVQEFGYLADELRASVDRVRMTPLAAMEALWQRAVRETAQDLDRPTQLEVLVGDVEIDLHLFELLKDPLLHLLRNAVAHGIEPAEERVAKGKARAGLVRIEAQAEGAFVHLRISDDGGGIDAERLVRRAQERGWVSSAAAGAMSEAERQALVFLPGFSTAEAVSTVAGRGMGLHAVQRNVEELGGRVALSSTRDLGGTTFELRVPTTLLSIRGLLVQSRAVTYALPLPDVGQVAVVAREALEQSEGSFVYRDDEQRPIRIRELDVLLGYAARPSPPRLSIVVLRRTGQLLGVVVDRVVGELDFVTYPLPWNVDGHVGINGALIQPDGSVALTLDPTALFAAAQRRYDGKVLDGTIHKRRILVVDDSLTTRVAESQTLQSAGYHVAEFPDGSAAWEALQSGPFDLVVSDVRMPGLDGFELTRRIRGSEALRQLPVVLVTGLDAPEDVKRGAEVGADEYIVKGELDHQNLLRAVRRLLR